MTTATPQPPATQPQRRRGAQPGNQNNTRHGMRGSSLPAGCGHVLRATCQFRRQVELAVLDARGEITLVDAAYVNTAFRAERHAQLAQRWLALEADRMTPGDRLNYSREVVRASAERDKALTALNLPQRPDADPWQTLQSHQTHQDHATRDAECSTVQVANRTPNAAEAGTEGHSDA